MLSCEQILYWYRKYSTGKLSTKWHKTWCLQQRNLPYLIFPLASTVYLTPCSGAVAIVTARWVHPTIIICLTGVGSGICTLSTTNYKRNTCIYLYMVYDASQRDYSAEKTGAVKHLLMLVAIMWKTKTNLFLTCEFYTVFKIRCVTQSIPHHSNLLCG